jgi:hypothetical protein
MSCHARYSRTSRVCHSEPFDYAHLCLRHWRKQDKLREESFDKTQDRSLGETLHFVQGDSAVELIFEASPRLIAIRRDTSWDD